MRTVCVCLCPEHSHDACAVVGRKHSHGDSPLMSPKVIHSASQASMIAPRRPISLKSINLHPECTLAHALPELESLPSKPTRSCGCSSHPIAANVRLHSCPCHSGSLQCWAAVPTATCFLPTPARQCASHAYVGRCISAFRALFEAQPRRKPLKATSPVAVRGRAMTCASQKPRGVT